MITIQSTVILLTLLLEVSIKDMLGESACWIMTISGACHNLKIILGGCFMAVYRFICVKRPEIAMNIQNSRRITNHLLIMELITFIFLLILVMIGAIISGTSPTMAFCRGRKFFPISPFFMHEQECQAVTVLILLELLENF